MDKNDETKKTSADGEAAALKNEPEVKPGEYLRAVKTHLRNGKQKDAYVVLQQAAVQFPNDPVILSYLGCFQSVVDKKYRTGVDTCKKAIALFKKQDSLEKEVLYPLFYLNLGRAYVAAGKKKDAIEVFTTGMKFDNGNSDLLRELRGLGARKNPPVPFLDRSNPINKYIGMILHATSTEPQKRKSQRISHS